LRILFSVRNPSYVRHYEGVIRTLAARGHQVDLVTERFGKSEWPHSVLALAANCPGVRLSTMPSLAQDRWWELATRFRQARFYLRFLEAQYRGMPGLLTRARDRAPLPAIRLAEAPGVGRLGRRLLAQALDMLDQSTRTAAAFYDYLRQLQPDLVVVTPLIVLKTCQLDLTRAAMELGIRNVFGVASWDHLSSKGELTLRPQQVLVWNDVQKREAMELHHLPGERILVTGSQVFDDWFVKQPSTSREAFCSRVGLRAERPILLYVCSALLEGSAPESEFVVRWATHLRNSGDPMLRDCGILVRPHFKRGDEWKPVTFDGLDNIVCWPPTGAVPDDAASKTDYFDSLYHASAVVGLNTSALIEAGILGRPVHTVLLPEFRNSQEGTVHFTYLLEGPNALLRAARSLDSHAADVAATLAGRDVDPERSARFVRAFVRPGAIDVPSTLHVVDALESIAAKPAPHPLGVPWWTGMIRPILRPFADRAVERIKRLKEEHRRQKEQDLIEHRRRRRAAEALARARDGV
jgi:hypothetical protein